MVTANMISGFYVNDSRSAFEAALVIGILNSALGAVAKVVTNPFAILSFGLFLVVINTAMIMLAPHVVTGFVVYGWVPAFWAAVVLAVLGIAINLIMKEG
jgi:putative membrane protein